MPSLSDFQFSAEKIRPAMFKQVYEVVPALAPFYTEFEKNYDGEYIRQWMSARWDMVFVCIALYGLMVWKGSSFVKKPLELRGPLAAWNIFLSVFSFIGMCRTVPHLLYMISTYSFKETICTQPFTSYGHSVSGLWTQLFMISKIPELVDTIFLVLRKVSLINDLVRMREAMTQDSRACLDERRSFSHLSKRRRLTS